MKILCFGDSNTYGFDSRSYFGERYPANERWVDILARSLGVECVNLGENGRRIPSRGTAPFLAPGEYMIIMLGGNDRYVALCYKCWRKKILKSKKR